VKWTPETAARGVIDGASWWLHGEASVVSIACSVGTPPGLVDAPQGLLHEVILAGKMPVARAFRHTGVPGVSRSTSVALIPAR
jgi:hypothetical protein